MRYVCGLAAGVFWMAACSALAQSAHGACAGPQALVAQLRAHATAQSAVQLGNWYADHRQFGCAADAFREGLKHAPGSAQLHYLVGLALVEDHKPLAGKAELEKAAQLAPRVVQPHLMLAMVDRDLGDHQAADQEWRKVLAIDPRSEEALEGLSDDLIAQKDYDAVVDLLQSAPRTETLTITLARALGLQNSLAPAADVLLEAMKKNPDSLPLAKAMAVVLIKQQKYQEAINLFEYQTKKHPGNLDAQSELFRILVLTDHINEAVPMGPKLLAEQPHDAEVLYLNGVVQRSLGNYEKARTYLQQAVAIDPNFFNSRYNLGMVLVLLKDYKGAKENLEKAIALGAPQPEIHYELAKALRGLGDMQGATREMDLFQQLKKADNDATEAALSVAQGDRDFSKGNYDEAVRQYRDAVQTEPQSASFRYRLAVALHRKGDTEAEKEQLEAAVKIDPKMASAQNALGYLLSRSGDPQGAVEHYKLATEAAPQWPDAWINLAAALAVESHYGEAKQAVAQALQLDPANAQAKALRDQLASDPAAQQ